MAWNNGLTQDDFNGVNANKGGLWKSGGVWSNPVALSGRVGRGGGGTKGLTLSQNSTNVSNAFVRGGQQLTRQFIAGGRSGAFTGTKGYTGFRSPLTLKQNSANVTSAFIRSGQQLTRQFIAGGRSGAFTGTKGYTGFRSPLTLKQNSANVTSAFIRGGQQLTRQFIAGGKSDAFTGTEGYTGFRLNSGPRPRGEINGLSSAEKHAGHVAQRVEDNLDRLERHGGKLSEHDEQLRSDAHTLTRAVKALRYTDLDDERERFNAALANLKAANQLTEN
jgi:hypothetical protein